MPRNKSSSNAPVPQGLGPLLHMARFSQTKQVSFYDQLSMCCFSGDAVTTKKLLDKMQVLEPNQKDILKIAVKAGHENVIKTLFAHPGLSVNTRFGNNMTILHFCIESGNFKSCKIVIECGANIEAKNKNGETPLHLACINNHKDIVSYLVENGASPIVKNEKGETPLHCAVELGYFDIAELLLELNNNTGKEVDNKGYLPIHCACKNGNIGLVNLLLKYLGDFNVYNTCGNNPIHIAILFSQIDLVKHFLNLDKSHLYIPNKNGETPLHLSVIGPNDNPTLLKYLHKEGLDIELLSKDKVTPLYSACIVGNIRCVKELVNFSADITFINSKGQSLLHICCENNSHTVIRYLLSQGLSSEIKDNNGDYPIHTASLFGNVNAVKELLLANPDLKLKTNENLQTPLHLACQNMHTELALYLLFINADCTVKDNVDNTPFHIACKMGDSTVVERMCETGCRIDIQNKNGYFPLDLAIKKEITSFLVQKEFQGPRIKLLDLSNCNIKTLPLTETYWESFSRLISINLRNNQLSSIPTGFLKIPKLSTVLLDNNPLEDIPSSYKKKHCQWKHISSYLHTLQENSERWSEQKIFVIGEPQSGKNSLLSALEKGKLCGHSKRVLNKSKDTTRTAGISIDHNRSFVFPKKKLFAKVKNFYGTIWYLRSDIASYCPFFFSNQAIYLLVFNILTIREHITSLDYWMQQIRLQTSVSSADILFIGTHKDDSQCTKEYIQQINKLINDRYPSNRYPQFKGVYIVSNKTGSGFTKLVKAMKESGAKTRPFVNPSWLVIHQNLQEAQTSYRYITWEKYSTILLGCGAKTTHIPEITHFLCSTSTIMFCDELSDEKKPSIIILDPLWLASIITRIRSIECETSQVNIIKLINNKLKEWATYDESVQQTIIRIIKRNNIVYEIKDNLYHCPWMLNDSIPNTILKEHWLNFPKPSVIQHGRIFDFTFVPIGIMDRIISTIYKISDIKLIYASSKQLLFSKSNQYALISYIPRRIDQRAYQLQIQARIPKRTRTEPTLFINLIEHIENLIDSNYSQLKSTLQSWIICSHCIASKKLRDNPYLFPYKQCVCTIIENPEGSLYCRDIRCDSRSIRINVIAPDICLTVLKSWIIPSNKLSFVKHLGEGATGDVNLMLLNNEKVAVKVLSTGKRDFIDEEDKINVQVQQYQELKKEILLMITLYHPNIIQIKGLCELPLRVVMEFAPLGDLHQLIRKQDPVTGIFTPVADTLPWKLKYHIALDIAQGLKYLSNNNVVHRDIRSPNIFLMTLKPKNISERVAVVADFGLSAYALPIVSGVLRTWRWLAPEVFHYTSTIYDTTSDIYSYGIVLWELIKGAYPFGEFTDDEWEVQEAIYKDHLRPTIPYTECDQLYSHLINRCWSASPSSRPTWDEIITTLLHLLEEPLNEPKIKEISPPSYQTPEMKKKITKRFLNFSEDTKEMQITSQLNIQKRVKCMKIIGDTIWLGTRHGEILIYNCRRRKEILANSKPINQWKVSDSGIVSLDNIVTTKYNTIWCVSGDGNITVWDSKSPYNKIWDIDKNDIIRTTSVTYSFYNGVSLLWTSLLQTDTSYIIRIWDTDKYSYTTLTIPKIECENSKVSIITSMIQFKHMLFIGSYQHIFIINIDQLELTGYFQTFTNSRLKQLLCIPELNQLWTTSANIIKVWKVASSGSVTMVKELDGHANQITAMNVLSKSCKRRYSIENIGSSTSVRGLYQVWSSSYDGQVLVWNATELHAIQEYFVVSPEIPINIVPYKSRTVIIATSCDVVGSEEIKSHLILCSVSEVTKIQRASSSREFKKIESSKSLLG